jgi:uncharacterized membrane protein
MHWMHWSGLDMEWNLVWLAIVIVVAVLAIYFLHRLLPPAEKSAEEILRERFARGEISQEEYQCRLKTLQGP